MHELVDLPTLERWFGLLAVALPVLAVGLGAALQLGARRPGALGLGILVGLLGPLNWLLWRVYNGIEDHYGLDSVKAMLLNLALFAALGVAVGIGVQVFRRSSIQTDKATDGSAVDFADPEHLNT